MSSKSDDALVALVEGQTETNEHMWWLALWVKISFAMGAIGFLWYMSQFD